MVDEGNGTSRAGEALAAPNRGGRQAQSRPEATLIALAALTVLAWIPVALGGRAAGLGWIYQRPAILEGEAWRLLTTHLTHLSGDHLAWNLAALAGLAALFGSALSRAAWARVILASSLSASLGVLLLEPNTLAMTGLSGVLHGLAAAGALGALWTARRVGAVILAVLILKLVWELFAGPLPWTTALGARIAQGSHLYGALGGLVMAAFELAFQRRQDS